MHLRGGVFRSGHESEDSSTAMEFDFTAPINILAVVLGSLRVSL